MKKKYLIFIASIFLFISGAFAGKYTPVEVDVDLDKRTAVGDMASARLSPYKNVFIGCGVRSFSEGADTASSFGFCQAEDSKGERAFCNTANAALLDVMKATSDYAYVSFSWNLDGECTRIGFSTQSFYLPE